MTLLKKIVVVFGMKKQIPKLFYLVIIFLPFQIRLIIRKIGKQFPPTIKKVLQTAENIKLVLLTATPMFNTAEEIVDLVNLLLLNDKKPLMQRKIFLKTENLPEVKGNI